MEQTEKPYLIFFAPDEKRIPAAKIIEATARVHEMTVREMTQRSPQWKYAHARHRAMWLIKALRPDLSLGVIARLLNLKDHTTVISGIQRVRRDMARRPEESGLVLQIARELGFTREDLEQKHEEAA